MASQLSPSSPASGLASVRPTAVAGLDRARLDAFLRNHVDGLRGELVIEQASGGMSNPTYFLTIGDWSAVLRKQPGISLSPSAHRIDREYRVISALHGSAIPVPAPILYCDDAAIVGTPFYLMERLQGRVFPDCSLTGVGRDDRLACYRSMAENMAAMHNFDWAGAGLGDYGRVGTFFERQINGWAAQWDKFACTDNPAVDQLLAWLRRRIPESDTTAICHGDYRFANLMFHPTEPRVVGIFDWELSTLGHPLADVAFNLQAWFLKPEDNGGILGLDLDALGIPSVDAYLDCYYAAAHSPERLTSFHIAFAMFRAAVGLTGVALREESGAVQQDNAPGQARQFARAYAAAGLTAIETWQDRGRDGR